MSPFSSTIAVPRIRDTLSDVIREVDRESRIESPGDGVRFREA
jgi:hypothetical protein